MNTISCAHGFRKNQSCKTQLLETVNDLDSVLDAGLEVDILFLDFWQLLTVSHNCLLHKLLHYGISGPVYNWITNFLDGSKLYLTIVTVRVSSGVPQGSVLGPLLFLLYLNKLPKNVTSTVRLYKDDFIIYRIIYSIDDDIKNYKRI